jgi:hypothetical protein
MKATGALAPGDVVTVTSIDRLARSTFDWPLWPERDSTIN